MAVRDDIISHHAAGTLPELLARSIRQEPHEQVAAELRAELIALHNDGTIDVLEPARTIADATIGQHDFFFVQHIYVDIIPKLDADVSAMFAAVKALVARAGNDLVSGMPNEAFRTWMESGSRAVNLFAIVDLDNGEDAAAIFLALQALAKSDPADALSRAVGYLAGTSLAAQLAATKALGTFDLPAATDQDRAMSALASALPTAADGNLRGHLVRAAAEMTIKVPGLERQAVSLIDAAGAAADDTAIHHSATALAFYGKKLPTRVIAALATIAQSVKAENKGTLDQIDHACRALVHEGRLEEALELIGPILSANPELATLDAFDSFSNALLSLPVERIAKIVATWLLSLNYQLGEAARGLVGDHHGDAPLVLDFDAAGLHLSVADTILLAHRSIGFLFMHPITAASLILPLIRSVDGEPRDVIAEILFDPLLINFSGGLADWLKGRADDDTEPAKPAIDAVLARLEAYLAGLRRTNRIHELRPSERERLIESHRQHESMRKAYAQAEQRSVLMSIVSRSVMLYGTRSVSYYNPSGGAPERHEMQLHSFSHSIESPRLDVLEPFDLDYTLRVFRSMRVAS